MAILTHTCPHCLTNNIALQILNATKHDPGWVAHLHCPKCELPSAALLKPSPKQGQGVTQWQNYSNYPGDVTDMGWRIEKFWPEAPKPIVPELLPPDIVRVYIQAERNFATTGNEEASGIMYRKALDIGLKKIDQSLAGTLGAKIKKLSSSARLTSDIAEWAEHIRDIGNDAAHEEDSINSR